MMTQGPQLDAFQSAGAVPKLIRASKTFTGATNYGEVGTNPLFTVTGKILVYGMWVMCTTDMADSVDGATFTIGVVGDADCMADWTAVDLDTLDAGEGVAMDGAATGVLPNIGSTSANTLGAVSGIAANIIMTVATQNITGGVLEFYLSWAPLSASASVSLGTGMVAL